MKLKNARKNNAVRMTSIWENGALMARNKEGTVMAHSPKLTNKQIERAGIGLVIWNLSRRGVDCQETPAGSHNSDVWADIGGDLVSIEVKATTGTLWHVRRNQVGKSPWHVFTLIGSGHCYVLARTALVECSRGFDLDGSEWRVSHKMFPSGCEHGWDAMLSHPRGPQKNDVPAVKLTSAYRYRRVCRRRMADGTVKEYHYGPDARPALRQPRQ